VGGPGRHRAIWLFAGSWLVLTAAVEFTLSYFLPTIGQPLGGAAFVVAGAGLGFELLGLAIGHLITRPGKVSWRGAPWLLGLGALVFPTIGFFFVLGLEAAGAVVLGGMLAVGAVIIVAPNTETPISTVKPPRWRTLRLFAVGGLFVGLFAFAGTSPYDSSLSVQFKIRDESRLHNLLILAMKEASNCLSGAKFPAVPVFGKLDTVCAGDGQADFYANNDDAYLWTEGAVPAQDECVFHLGGRWWEEVDIGPSNECPLGFSFIPGG